MWWFIYIYIVKPLLQLSEWTHSSPHTVTIFQMILEHLTSTLLANSSTQNSVIKYNHYAVHEIPEFNHFITESLYPVKRYMYTFPSPPAPVLLVWVWFFHFPHINEIIHLSFCRWFISLGVVYSSFINGKISIFIFGWIKFHCNTYTTFSFSVHLLMDS